MTHKEAAKRFGVSVGAVQKWEKRGFDRAWPVEQMQEWRDAQMSGHDNPARLRAKKLAKIEKQVSPEQKQEQTTESAPVSQPKLTAEQIMLKQMGFQEARTHKLKKEIERLEIKIAADRGQLVDREQMRQDAIHAVAIWCSELDALVSDLPGQLAGLSEPEILPKLRSRIELLKTNCRTIYADLARRGMESKGGEHGT